MYLIRPVSTTRNNLVQNNANWVRIKLTQFGLCPQNNKISSVSARVGVGTFVSSESYINYIVCAYIV